MLAACSAEPPPRQADRLQRPAPAAEPAPRRVDTLRLNGQRLLASYAGRTFTGLCTAAGDSVIRANEGVFELEFLDINADGYTDIQAALFASDPHACQNWLFDPRTRTYRLIVGENLYLVRLPGTALYHNYVRVGCGNDCWESHLIRLVDWREQVVGVIRARATGQPDDGIWIYRQRGDAQTLLQQLPAEQLAQPRYQGNQHRFIEAYWAANYRRF
ncbi:hypothetical protein [Hymenobacter jeollabukensis]|uniref:Uncharacterized protein n=1 Tax=Hymenobacter jeollabukensis TaxID=2025313 RepID=A0A5R8WPA6_9BACT|nr:hypothetical protein [Hymenobacter jeollabukensis]TLM91241.1 hypothetical protein FDY95_16760 [Hymenobacter jeollabukensis]